MLPLDLILEQKCLSGEINNSLSLESKLVLLGHYYFTSRIQAAWFWSIIVYFSAFFLFLKIAMLFFSCSVVSDSLRPHGLQHSRLSCPSLYPGFFSNSCPLCQWGHLLLLLPSIFPSIRIFSSKLALHIRWSKYWSFNFRISSAKEYPRLISLRID